MKPTKEFVDAVCRKLVDEGKLIEAGWAGLKLTAIPDDASTLQLNEMRMAFFAGAQHLFATIMGILEPGAEPTDTDLRRMDAINRELNRFLEEFKLRHAKPEGSA